MRKKWKWIISIVSLLILGTAGYYGYSIVKFGMDISKSPDDSRFKKFYEDKKLEPVYEPPKWEGKERVNILLLGGDSRGLSENEIPRSDSIMIASINPKTKTAELFSILRDTYVDIPGHNANRINAALALGGPDLAMKTVSDLTGLPIQYYLYVDFQGFIKLIDAIGGIDFFVEKNMKYTDPSDDPRYNIDLKKGQQHLDGNKALQYVRFRHDALSDFTRTERQRNFMKAVAIKLKSTWSLVKLPNTLNEIEPYIETNMGLGTMLKLGTLSFSINSGSIVGAQLPPNELLREERIRGAQVITVDPDALKQYIAEQFAKSESPGEPNPEGTTDSDEVSAENDSQ